MTKIKKYVEYIDEELCEAKEYAEKYVECKAAGDMPWANRYKEMANDELKHAMYLHERAIQEIEKLNEVFKPTTKMQETWDKSHEKYVEKSAWIKTMLAM